MVASTAPSSSLLANFTNTNPMPLLININFDISYSRGSTILLSSITSFLILSSSTKPILTLPLCQAFKSSSRSNIDGVVLVAFVSVPTAPNFAFNFLCGVIAELSGDFIITFFPFPILILLAL